MRISRGFTLIELLVVVAIMGILSTMALSSFSDAQKKARDSQRKSDAGQIRSALEMAREDDSNGKYPTASSSPSVTNITTLGTFMTNKGYMKAFPTDPVLGYYYLFSPGTDNYTLGICLENANDPKRDMPTPQPQCKGSPQPAARPASITYQAP